MGVGRTCPPGTLNAYDVVLSAAKLEVCWRGSRHTSWKTTRVVFQRERVPDTGFSPIDSSVTIRLLKVYLFHALFSVLGFLLNCVR